MVAVTHGRPPMMSSQLATSLSLPKQLHQHDSTTHTAFFVKSVELYEIIQSLYYGADERSRVYAFDGSISNEHSDDLGMVIQLDRELVKWERNLPDWLRCNTRHTRGEVTHRQAVVLHIRYVCSTYLGSVITNSKKAFCTRAFYFYDPFWPVSV
jgi:hypothetical protein